MFHDKPTIRFRLWDLISSYSVVSRSSPICPSQVQKSFKNRSFLFEMMNFLDFAQFLRMSRNLISIKADQIISCWHRQDAVIYRHTTMLSSGGWYSSWKIYICRVAQKERSRKVTKRYVAKLNYRLPENIFITFKTSSSDPSLLISMQLFENMTT